MVFFVRCYFILCNSIHLDQLVCAQLFSILLYCTALYCTPSLLNCFDCITESRNSFTHFPNSINRRQSKPMKGIRHHALPSMRLIQLSYNINIIKYFPTSPPPPHSIPSSLPVFSFLFFASLTSDIRSEQQQSSVSPSVKGPISSKASSRYDRLRTCQGAILLRYHWQNRQESHSSERKRGSKCFPSFLPSFFLFNILPSPMRNVRTTLSSPVLSFRRWVIRSSTRCHHPYLFHF